jgi:hypothetical protein
MSELYVARQAIRGFIQTDPLPKGSSTVDSNGCWRWQRKHDKDGYGRMYVGSMRTFDTREEMAHRIAYTVFRGPIPEGLPLDHLCRVRDCVNPWHLDAVTHAENIARGEGLAAQNARKTHCLRGHKFTPENTYRKANGGRGCWECRRTAHSRRKARIAR